MNDNDEKQKEHQSYNDFVPGVNCVWVLSFCWGTDKLASEGVDTVAYAFIGVLHF